MEEKVCNGASRKCSHAVGPGVLAVMPLKRVNIGGQPAANIADAAPSINVAPFPLCNSKANPLVLQAITASQGSVNVAPCQFAPAGQWSPGSKVVKIAGQPALTKSCKLKCIFNGEISISDAGQTSVSAK